MSYNIEKWKTKKIEGLRIPLEPKFWEGQPQILDISEPTKVALKLDAGDGQIIGTLAKGYIEVSDIKLCSEGSGYCYEDQLKPALERSTGELEALLFWEEPGVVSRLKVTHGCLTDLPVEL